MEKKQKPRLFSDYVTEEEAKMTPKERELLEKWREHFAEEAKRIQEEED